MPAHGAVPPDPHTLFAPLDFSGHRCIVAAVSGGGDSLALLHLLKAFAAGCPGFPDILAVTVDHRLRPESADEARQVGETARALGIAHRTMIWTEPKPAHGISKAAREARHRLLAEAASGAGAGIVLTGHTADDQAETVAMRGERAAGRGEAGIAPATLYDRRIWFLRPLLAIRRQALRDYLSAGGIGWIDDPSNLDMHYERVRTRHAIIGNETGFAALIGRAESAANDRTMLGERAARWLEAYASIPFPGLLRLPPEALHAAPDALLYGLRILLSFIGGTPHMPNEAAAKRLVSELSEGAARAGLSRAVVDRRRGGIFLYREGRGLPDPAAAAMELWDGRWQLTLTDNADGLRIAPLGRTEAMRRIDDAGDTPRPVAVAAFSALPALWRGDECVGLPGPETTPVRAISALGPWTRFLPCFDLAPAKAMTALASLEPLPRLPFARHIANSA